MNYADYIAENLDNCISYTDYIVENLDKCIGYADYIAENLYFTENKPNIREIRKKKLEQIMNRTEIEEL